MQKRNSDNDPVVPPLERTLTFLELEEICDRFEEGLRSYAAGELPHDFLEQFISAHAEIDMPGVIFELLMIDAAYRLEQGLRVFIEDYCDRFPQFKYRLLDTESREHDTTLAQLRQRTRRDQTEGASREASVEVLGPYKLLRQLGEGAFGCVWLGSRSGALVTTQVAIKIPGKHFQDMNSIQAEAKAWVRASGHPNVVPIIEADVYNDTMVIVSEFVEGGSLRDKLERSSNHRLRPDEAIDIMIGVLSGLEYLHSRGIIHRDLKPANILLQQDIPRLTDFGLSRESSDITTSGRIAGTPAYMAPEAFDGERTRLTDVWSAGIVFHELLTGRTPYAGLTLSSLMRQVMQPDPVPIASNVEISGELKDILSRSLAKRPEDRFRSAADMRAALNRSRITLPTATNSACRQLTVAVTGSMLLDTTRLRAAIERHLQSLASELTTWYVGSNGTTDLAVLEFLAAADQCVYIVGYDSDDISEPIERIIQDRDIPFLDATAETVPEQAEAPSKRDVYFASKADIVVLFWDGKSRGTERLIRWLQSCRRDYFLVFI